MHKPNYIKVAFWNVGNLFDIEKNEIATDFEFTPERGWTKDVRDRKLNNLAKVIKSMNFTDIPMNQILSLTYWYYAKWKIKSCLKN